MSRTKRKILSTGKEWFDNLFIDEVDDSLAKHRKAITGKRLTPYTNGFKVKEKPENGRWDGKRKSKTERDNVNRSYKKSLRQKLKNELKQQLNEY